MAKHQPNEKIASYALLGMTAVTGTIDGVSFLALGREFPGFGRAPQNGLS
jgi:hypothetical protein